MIQRIAAGIAYILSGISFLAYLLTYGLQLQFVGIVAAISVLASSFGIWYLKVFPFDKVQVLRKRWISKEQSK